MQIKFTATARYLGRDANLLPGTFTTIVLGSLDVATRRFFLILAGVANSCLVAKVPLFFSEWWFRKIQC